jgi:hypothetical protein
MDKCDTGIFMITMGTQTIIILLIIYACAYAFKKSSIDSNINSYIE